MIRIILIAAAAMATPPAAAAPQSSPPAAQPSPAAPPYADLADLVLAAPIVADATIRSASRIKGPEAAGVAPGLQRFYVEANVTALIRGAAGLPPRVGYLVDVAPDARGRTPRLRKQRVLLFARPTSAPGQLQLAAPDAQVGWTPAAEARVREIARAVVASNAAPAITGIGDAFHVPGALPGESETQVFLRTAEAQPVSLSILRRPGQSPRWSVALGEIVDDAAGPPSRDSLLWYRLACGLPATLPETSTTALEPASASAARADYDFVRTALGACGRTRGASTSGAAPA